MGPDAQVAVGASEVGRVPSEMRVGDHAFATWPPAQPVRRVRGAGIVTTRFADAVRYHATLVAEIEQAAANPRFRDSTPRTVPWACGFKVRHLPQWQTPAAALAHARAVALAHRVTGLGPVYTDDSWGNIYRNGDYCPPHTHVRSLVSVVYMVEPGDLDPGERFAGRLIFMDPRIEWCCAREPGRPTRPFIPELAAGSMIAFAGEYLHSVNPYTGHRPRITLSWNFTRVRLCGEGRPRLVARPDDGSAPGF